jgi:hypothetical protein
VSADERNLFAGLTVYCPYGYLYCVIQQILVGIIFLSALAFLASLLIRNLQAKEGCATGCGKCSTD